MFCDLLPFMHSTRTRKMALALAASSPEVTVRAVTLDRAGRQGIEDLRSRYSEGGVEVDQVHLSRPFTAATAAAMMGNLAWTYPIGLARLTRRVLGTPADTVVAGSMPVLWLAGLHHVAYGSRVVVNARERLGGIRTKGSLASLVSIVEPLIVRALKGHDITVTTVCEGHAEDFRRAGLRDVLVIRNLPDRAFVNRPFRPLPPLTELRVVLVGSLYEGRGVGPLIEAVAGARKAGLPVRLDITGRGTDGFISAMEKSIQDLDAGAYIRFLGPCAPEEVRSRYEAGHVGTALYEPVDAANDSLSNKLFEAMASGRPVLAGDLTENVRVIREYGIGWVTEVTPQAIQEALGEIWAQRTSLDALALHCARLGTQQLNWEREVTTLTDVLIKGGQ